jgi:hypothetical protein
MIISQAIDLLQNAELKQLKVGEDKIAVRGFINSAILELYKRFNLWEAEALITMASSKFTYGLDGTDTDVFMDLTDHDFLMVQEVYDNLGEPLSLNDEKDPYGVSTPKYNNIELVSVIAGDLVSVIYRAAPVFLSHEKAVIPLPPQFNEALFHYVGYRAHGSVKGDVKSENNTHYIRFESSCERIKKEGLFNQDDMASYKFETRGFV